MNKHLLPCSCGAQTEVDANQAGLQVACKCGRSLEVPTLRGLKALPPAQPDAAGKRTAPRRESTWGPGQGLLFLGSLVLLVGLALAAWLWQTRPPEQMLVLDTTRLDKMTDSLTLAETWGLWVQLRQGLNRVEHPALAEIDKFKNRHYLKLYAAIGLAACGAAVMAAGLFVAPSKAMART